MDSVKITSNQFRKPLREVAAEYASHGLSTIVASRQSKVSLINWKFYQDEPPSAVEREAMFSLERNLNIAVMCGRSSGNLAVVDAETEAAFIDQVKRCDRAGVGNTWLVKTARGGHIYLRLPVSVTHFQGKDFEIRGQGQYVITAPSIHPRGTPYVNISSPGVIANVPSLNTLDWLPLKAAPDKLLPRKARRLLEGEAATQYDTRSEAEQAIIATLRNAGFTLPETLALFRTYPAAGKFAELEAKDSDNAVQWLRLCFERAGLFCASDSTARKLARSIRASAELSPWPGRTGSTDRDVFLAHTSLAHRAGQPTYHASSRDVAEVAGCERMTASRANNRLVKAGFLELVERANSVYANRYRLVEKVKFEPLPHMVLDRVDQSSPFLLPDAFRRRGLGRASFEVLRALESGPLTALQLQKQTGRCIQTVRKSLTKLAALGHVSKERKQWFGKLISEINFDELAKVVGTHGARKRQQEKHRAQRLRRQILNSI